MKKRILYQIIAIIVITFLVFSPCLKNDFINFDDHKLITGNPLVVSDQPFRILDFLRYNMFSPHYKPLTFITWNLEYRLFGLNSRIFHLNNLLLHIFNGILVYFISWHLASPKQLRNSLFAICCSLFFVIHPLRVESVAWASERKDLLCSFFFLLSLLAYQIYRQRNSKGFLCLSVFAYLLVIGSKASGITLVAVLFLMDWWDRRPFSWKLLTEKLPHIIILIAGLWLYGLFDRFEMHTAGLTAGFINDGYRDYPAFLEDVSPGHIRILIITTRIVLWLWHILFPATLSPVYPPQEILRQLGYGIHLFPVLILLLTGLVLYFRKYPAFRLPLFAFQFFLIALSPALSITEHGLGVFLPDRYTYLPSLGIIFMLAGIMSRLAMDIHVKPIVYGIMALTLAGFSLSSHQRCRVWQTSETVWTHVLTVFPDNGAAWNGRGKFYSDTGQQDKALHDFNTAIARDPTCYWAYYNRANILFERGQLERALQDYLLLTRVDRWFAEAFTNLGAVYCRQGQYELALKALDRAHRLKTTDPNTLLNRGVAFLNLKEYSKSIDDFLKYLQSQPGNADVINTIGVAYVRMNRKEEAEIYFRKALEIRPDFEVCQKNLAILMNKKSN